MKHWEFVRSSLRSVPMPDGMVVLEQQGRNCWRFSGDSFVMACSSLISKAVARINTMRFRSRMNSTPGCGTIGVTLPKQLSLNRNWMPGFGDRTTPWENSSDGRLENESENGCWIKDLHWTQMANPFDPRRHSRLCCDKRGNNGHRRFIRKSPAGSACRLVKIAPSYGCEYNCRLGSPFDPLALLESRGDRRIQCRRTDDSDDYSDRLFIMLLTVICVVELGCLVSRPPAADSSGIPSETSPGPPRSRRHVV